MTESWLPVPGYEGLYSVSDCGRVRAEARTVVYSDPRAIRPIIRNRKTMILKSTLSGSGYPKVSLFRDGVMNQYQVHALVLTAFVGPRPEPDENTKRYEGLHSDDVKTNNVLSNLRWGTATANKLDAVKNGRNPGAVKTHCKQGHGFTEENTRINKRGRRECRACGRDKQRARFGWKERKSA